MNTTEIKRAKGLQPVYFKGLDISDMTIDLSKRTVKMVWSAFNVKDDDNDIILPGAFARSIAERGPDSNRHRKIAYLKYHNWHLPVGPLTSLVEDQKYLIATATIDPTPEGDTTVTQYQTKTLNQHSIGYRYVWDKGRYSEEDDAFIWAEIELYEGSAVVAGANGETPLLEIRDGQPDDIINRHFDELEKLLRGVEIKTQFELRRNIATILQITKAGQHTDRKQMIKETKEVDWLKIATAIKSSN